MCLDRESPLAKGEVFYRTLTLFEIVVLSCFVHSSEIHCVTDAHFTGYRHRRQLHGCCFLEHWFRSF